MSTQSAPPPPDMSGVAAASEAAARMQQETAREQLDWAREQYAGNKGVTDQVVESFLDAQGTATANSKHDRARYERQFQPLEDSLVEDAKTYSSGAKRDLETGRAKASVAQSFQAARTNAQRDLEGFGVNPGATRFAALDIGARAQEAATMAAAGNQAALQVDATGRALRSEAINIGRGYPGQVSGEANTSLQAGTGAVNSGLATTGSGAQTMGTPTQWNGLANQSLGQWGNTINQGYANQMSQFNANQKASSGIGSALGLVAGLGTMAIPRSSIFGKMFADGGEVPEALSPSRGAAIDDVRASTDGAGALQVNVGEFIVPKDTVTFKGTEFFHKLIVKSRDDQAKAKQESGAVPTLRPAVAQRPSAIPMTSRQRAA